MLLFSDWFHKLINIHYFEKDLGAAKALAQGYFDVNKPKPGFPYFEYSPEAFEAFFWKKYAGSASVETKPHWLQSGLLEDGRNVGAFSRKAVVEYIKQWAVFNLIDGVWLQRSYMGGPINSVRGLLFKIWQEESGSGDPGLNHCNMYSVLLGQIGVGLPTVFSKDFLKQDFLPSAWEIPVFLLAVGLFPNEFFPEILGMTFYLEWETPTTMKPIVKLLKRHGIPTEFYDVHVAIDNPGDGHGANAMAAIKIFLEERSREGGAKSVEESWRRILNGYHTWAGLTAFDTDLTRHILMFDGKLPYAERLAYVREQMKAFLARIGPIASFHHDRSMLGTPPSSLQAMFADPDRLMAALVGSKWVDLEDVDNSRFFTELAAPSGPMFSTFTAGEIDLMKRWLKLEAIPKA